MKLSAPLTVALALITKSYACAHFQGEITDAGSLKGLSGISAWVDDNGIRVCDGGSRIDQDGHYSLSCLPGYVFAVTKNGAVAWYQNGAGNSWQLDLRTSRSSDCCGGETAKGGCVFPCTNYDWNINFFC